MKVLKLCGVSFVRFKLSCQINFGLGRVSFSLYLLNSSLGKMLSKLQGSRNCQFVSTKVLVTALLIIRAFKRTMQQQ